MASRNLSLEYAELRSAHRSNYPRGSEGVQPVGPSTPSTSVAVLSIPAWVQYKESIRRDVEQLREDLHLLQNLHAARLNINFDPESVSAQDKEIQRVVEGITAALRRCEGNIKRIAMAGGDPRQLQQQERTVMMNAMRAMAIEVNAANKTFRHTQKEFLDSLRKQQTEEAEEGAGSSSTQVDSMVDTLMDPNQSLDEEQQQALSQLEDESQDRLKEIVKVAQSINELASLFKELNVLVIEQGTILDRIDYNVELAVERVNKGVVDLVEADKTSSKAWSTKCIGVLLAIVVVLVLVIIIQKSAA